MDAPRTAPVWRIVVGWCVIALLGFILVHSLIEGDVVWGKSVKVHYTRSRDPGVYWLTIAFQSLILGILTYSSLKIKPETKEPPKPDPTPRDWMGNPLDRN
jgi:hypothetical protein